MALPGRQFNSANYRYGFNGKENDNEVKGTGNSLNFGARINDPRLGRWQSVDPKASKYPFFSPYVAFGNNPNVFTDPGGETLKVVPKGGSVEQFKTVVQTAFSGKVFSKVSENGTVTFHKVPDTKLTKYETNAFNALSDVTNSEYTAIFILENKSIEVNGGRYHTGQIDLYDIEKQGNDDMLETSKGVLAHEALEQIERQKLIEIDEARGSSDADEYTNGYKVAHDTAEELEEGYGGFDGLDRSGGVAQPGLLLPDGKGGTKAILTESNVKQKSADGSIKTGTLKDTYLNNNLDKQEFIPDKK